MNFIVQVILWIFIIYGLLSLIQDILHEITYKKINHDLKICIFLKNTEKNKDKFLTILKKIKQENPYNQIVLVDLDNNINFKTQLQENEINVKALNKDEGKEFVSNCFQNENISFF